MYSETQAKRPNSTRCTHRNQKICIEIDLFRKDGLTVPEAVKMIAVKFHLAPDTVRDIYYYK